MEDYFHGKPRKIGCVMLLTAVLLVFGWIRSRAIEDEISFAWSEHVYMFVSANSSLGLCYFQVSKTASSPQLGGVAQPIDRFKKVPWVDSPFTVIFLRYEFLTISLTLLAAGLILWKQ